MSYNLNGLTDQELGHLLIVLEDDWPENPEQTRLRIEYINEVYEEFYVRWACADSAGHRQGERL